MVAIRVPKSMRSKRELLKHAPKIVENGKKMLILHGTKTSAVLNSVLADLFHLKRDHAVKYTKKNDSIRPFESGGETSLEFFSLKSDCSLLVYGSHSKKRPNNLVLGRTYDHHIYDLIKSVQELKHLKEMLLDHFKGEVVENLNLVGVDRIFVCTAISPTTVYMMHCALRLKPSGTSIPRMELLEVGPSMDLVVRQHRLPAQDLQKEAMKAPGHAKKTKNVTDNIIDGKRGRIYIPDQEIGKMTLTSDIKGLKRERRDAKKNKEHSKKLKVNPE
ncbi:hypothetical protein ACQ4PT_050280 [Festuca glaucescens]